MTGTGFLRSGKVKTASHYTRVVVASLLVLVTLVNITFAWIDREREGVVYPGSYISVSADGIMMENTEGVTDKITIEDVCQELTECSSMDGKNIYFPVTDPSSDNGVVRYRKADANDQNTKYISLEFVLFSDKNTDVWISNESYILGSATDAIRVSIDLQSSGSRPIVLDGSDGRPTTSTYAVEYIDADGYAHSEMQTSSALGRYFFTATDDKNGYFIEAADNELFSLKAGVAETVVVTVWLEGADPECRIGAYDQTDLQINLRFTTGVKDPRVLKFSDFTYESWATIRDVRNVCDDETFESFQASARRRVFVRDTVTKKLYAMVCEQSSEDIVDPYDAMSDFYHWTVTVPSSVTTVEFIRLDYKDGYSIGYPGAESNWEFWEVGKTNIENSSGRRYLRFYALEGGSKGADNRNLGRWSNRTDIVTVYFVDNRPESCETRMGFDIEYPYYTRPEDESVSMKMTYVGRTEDGKNVYAARIPAVTDSEFDFVQSAHGARYTGIRRYDTYNLFTVTHNFNTNTYTSKWSKNTSAIYPIT